MQHTLVSLTRSCQATEHEVGARFNCRKRSRLDRAVLGGRTWHRECRECNGDLPAELPLSFASVDEYVRGYEALLFEEACEAVSSGWAEAAEADTVWQASIIR